MLIEGLANGDCATVVFSGLTALFLLGNIKSDKELDEMLDQAPGQLNFTVFLAMMGDKIKGKINKVKVKLNTVSVLLL